VVRAPDVAPHGTPRARGPRELLIAFAEYALQVPANRIGYGVLSLAQLKITQEIITMTVFAGYALLWAGEALRWNYVAAAGCLIAAAILIFHY
jgi:uncharacterized protein (DUF486 family)